MRNDTGPLVRVNAQWDGWRTSEVRLLDLHDVHWLQPAGAPHPMIHASVSCTDLTDADIHHDCEPSSAPHRLQICVLKAHVVTSIYAELARLADAECRAAHDGIATVTSRTAGASVRPGDLGNFQNHVSPRFD